MPYQKPPSNVQDITTLRKKRDEKKRKNSILSFFIIAIVITGVCAALLSLNTDVTVFEMASKIFPFIGNSSEFPLQFLSETGFSINKQGSSICVVLTREIQFVDSGGNITHELKHGYNKPQIISNSNRTLSFGRTQETFSLDSSSKNIYTQTSDGPIITADLSEDNKALVVSENTIYSSATTIYDQEGNDIFKLSSSENNVVAANFISNDIIGLLHATSENGQIKSIFSLYNIIDGQHIASLDFNGTLYFKIQTIGDSIGLIGDQDTCVVNKNGDIISNINYNGKSLLAFDKFNKDYAVLCVGNSENLSSDEIIVVDSLGEISKRFECRGDVKAVYLYEQKLFLLTKNELYHIDELNNTVKYDDIGYDILDICFSGNSIYLLKLGCLDKIDIK